MFSQSEAVLHSKLPYGSASQKLCYIQILPYGLANQSYIQMLLNIDKSGERD